MRMASTLWSQHLASCLSLPLVSGLGVSTKGRSRSPATGTTLAFLRRLPEELGHRPVPPELASDPAAFLFAACSTEPTLSPSYTFMIRGLRRGEGGERLNLHQNRRATTISVVRGLVQTGRIGHHLKPRIQRQRIRA